MAHRAIEPVSSSVERHTYVRHDRFEKGRRSGVLEVSWRIDADAPVVIGAGWYQLRDLTPPPPPPGSRRRRPGMRVPPAPRPEVVAEIVRRQGAPVLPGSSLKGAVRQVYELLTPSCRPAVPGSCQVRPPEQQPRVCPACSLFGAPGLGGRLSFGEASPVAGRVQVRKIAVPTAWPPRRDKPGTLKVYDPQEAFNPRSGHKQPKSESTWAVSGEFCSRIRIVNADDDELGLLLGALGHGAASPMLRLGGKKFDGLGGVDVALLGVRWHHPERTRLDAEAAEHWAAEKVCRAIHEQTERQRTWVALHAALTADGRRA